MTRHAQITQNNKFAISFQYLKKEVSDEVVLVPKTASLQCLYNIPKKRVREEVDFLQADKHQSYQQLWASKFPTR